jgi:hypothetical protein
VDARGRNRFIDFCRAFVGFMITSMRQVIMTGRRAIYRSSAYLKPVMFMLLSSFWLNFR